MRWVVVDLEMDSNAVCDALVMNLQQNGVLLVRCHFVK